MELDRALAIRGRPRNRGNLIVGVEERRAPEKAGRLAPLLEQVVARKPASDHPPLVDADYEIPAIPRSTADREGSEKFHRYLDDLAGKMAAGEDVRRRLA